MKKFKCLIDSRLIGLFLVPIVLVCALSFTLNAQQGLLVVLEDMDQNMIIGQKAKTEWGDFWSAPAVTGINLGYLAEHGYPRFVSDSNGNGEIDSEDLVSLVDKLGREEYMNTDPDAGTSDPHLIRGLARYVSEKYPDTFEIKVYEDNFPREYADETGEGLPEELFGVPVSTFTNPEFDVYHKELKRGEMIWLGVSQPETNFNHFLAGRSFSLDANLIGNFSVDFADPGGDSGKGRIIETEMAEDGRLSYQGEMRPVDVMVALSPIEEEESPEGPNLQCDINCSVEEVSIPVGEPDTGGHWECCCAGGDLCGSPERAECGYSPPELSGCGNYEGKTIDGTLYCCENWKWVGSGDGGSTTEYVTGYRLNCEYTVMNTGGTAARPKNKALFTDLIVTGGFQRCMLRRDRAGWVRLGPGQQKKLNFSWTFRDKDCIPTLKACGTDVFRDVEEENEKDNTTIKK